MPRKTIMNTIEPTFTELVNRLDFWSNYEERNKDDPCKKEKAHNKVQETEKYILDRIKTGLFRARLKEINKIINKEL